MTTRYCLTPRAVLVGVGLAISPSIFAQEISPTPAVEPAVAVTPGQAPTQSPTAGPAEAAAQELAPSPAPVAEPMATATPPSASTPAPEASATPPREAASECVPSPTRGFFSRPQVPMPPELQGDVVIVKTGAIRISGKPPSLKPYLVKELQIGAMRGAGGSAGFNLDPFRLAFGFQSMNVRQEFSFQLVKEDAPGTPKIKARCTWGSASVTGSLSRMSTGFEMKVPQGNTTLCEFFDEPDAGPWRLFLWVGPPSNLIPPEFPSGGGLVRGEVRYQAASTNAMKPAILGLKPTVITGTFFTKEGHAVAAVERLIPGRVLMQCSVPAAERPLFVAVGAALFIRDGMAMSVEY